MNVAFRIGVTSLLVGDISTPGSAACNVVLADRWPALRKGFERAPWDCRRSRKAVPTSIETTGADEMGNPIIDDEPGILIQLLLPPPQATANEESAEALFPESCFADQPPVSAAC